MSGSIWQGALKLESEGKEQQALDAWKKGVTTSLEEAPILGSSGLMGMSPENIAQELHTLTMDIKSGKNMYEAFTSRGFIFALLGEFELAEADLSQAIDLEPVAMDARFYRGVVRSQSKNFLRAIEDFDEVTKVNSQQTTSILYDPGDAFFYRGLSKLMISGKREEAYDDLNKAVKISEKKRRLYQMVIDQLGYRVGGGDVRVYFDPFELPEYSVYMDNGKEIIRSLYLYRAIGTSRLLFVWEVRL